MQPTSGSPVKHGKAWARSFRAFACPLVLLCVVLAPAAARGVDLAGCYELTVDDPGHGCRWRGPMLLTQAGTTINGVVDLALVAGGSGCPPAIVGTGSGSVTGSSFVFGFTSGGFGTSNFTGTVSSDGKFAQGAWESSTPASGTWYATSTSYTVPADVTVTRPADGCRWTGPMMFTVCAEFDAYTASVALIRAAGGSSCPSTITGTVSGTATGTPPDLSFDLTSREFGNDHFAGMVSQSGLSAEGTWSGDAGTGTWFARLYLPGNVRAPAMGGIGLAILLASLVAAGMRSARRRRA